MDSQKVGKPTVLSVGGAAARPYSATRVKIVVGAIHELLLQVFRSDEVAAQSRETRAKWTFYETLNL
jgi:hypothetical protein